MQPSKSIQLPPDAQPLDQDLKQVVFRVQYDRVRLETKLIALDLLTKQWYQSPVASWATHREQLKGFGVSELSLCLTDHALSTGTRDAQFAAVAMRIRDLEEQRFYPLVW